MKRIILLLVAATMVVSGTAHAQSGLTGASKLGTEAWGQIIPVWNTTDSLIYDGSVVVLDTTSTIKRLGVRNHIPASTSRFQVLGLAVGDISRSSRGGTGKVLVYGYHPRARVGASGVLFGANLKFGTINGSLALADTVQATVAVVLGGNAGVYHGALVVYKYKLWYHGTRIAGNTL